MWNVEQERPLLLSDIERRCYCCVGCEDTRVQLQRKVRKVNTSTVRVLLIVTPYQRFLNMQCLTHFAQIAYNIMILDIKASTLGELRVQFVCCCQTFFYFKTGNASMHTNIPPIDFKLDTKQLNAGSATQALCLLRLHHMHQYIYCRNSWLGLCRLLRSNSCCRSFLLLKFIIRHTKRITTTESHTKNSSTKARVARTC